MKMFRFFWVVLVGVLMAACGGGGATPQLIAEYPSTGVGVDGLQPIASEPSNVLVVYDAYLQLDVRNPARAAEQAIEIASDYGGYLVSSQSVYYDDGLHATLVLAVPVARFERAKQALMGLGTLRSESVTGELTSGYDSDGYAHFSHITLQLQPTAGFTSSVGSSSGWNPARTFAQAFGVFAAIFQFLVDILIWILVVVGPFVLMGWGARALWLRQRGGETEGQ